MKYFRSILFSCILLILLASETSAQCSMCRAGAESNINKKENKIGRGLNTGILYLMSVPYMMGGVAFFIWYKHRRKAA